MFIRSRFSGVPVRSQHTAQSIGFAPVAELERFAGGIHRADRQDGIERRGYVKAVATIITRRGDDKYAPPSTVSNDIRQERVGRAAGSELSSADVDHLSAGQHGTSEGTRQIQLRTRLERAVSARFEDWQNDAAAPGSDTRCRTDHCPEQDTGDQSPVLRV
jgi:hypothetical protein